MIFIASDHAGLEAKNKVVEFLKERSLEVQDLGTHTQESCSYSSYAQKVAQKVSKKEGRGILICGSGMGVSMVANRYQGVRAALCRSLEDAKLSRQHNDSNILCLGARATELAVLLQIVEVWLKEQFEGGRHQDRIALFDQLGEKA